MLSSEFETTRVSITRERANKRAFKIMKFLVENCTNS